MHVHNDVRSDGASRSAFVSGQHLLLPAALRRDQTWKYHFVASFSLLEFKLANKAPVSRHTKLECFSTAAIPDSELPISRKKSVENPAQYTAKRLFRESFEFEMTLENQAGNNRTQFH